MTAAPGPPLDPSALGLRAPGPADVAALRELLGEEAVITAADRLDGYGRDETENLGFAPDVVVLPATTAQVAAVLRLASAGRLPVVPR
ncbi:MAG: FAD-binding oxidoreductase, partial [Thermoanaerobaculia bacterium]